MRLEAVEDDVDVLGGEGARLDVAAIAGVEEQGGVDPGEQAILDHRRLAAPPLLGGRPEEDDLARQLVRDRGERDGGTDARRGHRVVAAAVAEPGQRVVLGEDPDPRSDPAATAPPRRPDRRLEPSGRVLDLEPAGAGGCPPPSRLPGAPRTRVPGWRGCVRQPDDLVARRLDGGCEASLDVGVWLRRTDDR